MNPRPLVVEQVGGGRLGLPIEKVLLSCIVKCIQTLTAETKLNHLRSSPTNLKVKGEADDVIDWFVTVLA